MEWRENRALYILMFLFVFTKGMTQEAEKLDVDSVWWKSKTEQIDYTEDAIEFNTINPRNHTIDWFNGPLVMYIVLILIVIVLLYILYRLFGKELWSANEQVDIREFTLLKEKDLDDRFYDMDLEDLLQNAVNKQEWKMAIRIQFLISLKYLIEKKQLKWHKDLTNFQIVYQLKNREDRKKMKAIVRDFEEVWYGNQESTEDFYYSFKQKVDLFMPTNKSTIDE